MHSTDVLCIAKILSDYAETFLLFSLRFTGVFKILDHQEGWFGRPDLMDRAQAWDNKDPGANLHSVTLGK